LNIIIENIKTIREKIDNAVLKSGQKENIRLLAATKTVPVQEIDFACENGIDLIGENRVQEYLSKIEYMKNNAERHFIGSLQTNKVSQLVGTVSMIQSVDSIKLANEIAKRSIQKNITTDILIEINIAGENTKSGIDPNQIDDFFGEIMEIKGINLRGLMTIPPIFEKISKKTCFFEKMYKLFIDIRSKKGDNSNVDILSMGMSDDFEQAIMCGSNLVRIGSSIFGQR